jgi:hypothetical protein
VVNTYLRLPLALAGVLLLAACGGDDAVTGGSARAADLPDDACAQLALAPIIENQLGGKAEALTESVTEDGDTIKAQCVWKTPAPQISEGSAGAIIELVIQSAPRSDLDQVWEATEKLDVAPPDWRPATRVETTDATPPKEEWETTTGSDYLHPIAGAGAVRQLSFRAAQGDDFVARVTVRLDAKGAGSAGVGTVADAALAAVPALFE